VPYGAEVLPGSEQGLRRWVVAPFQGAVEFMGLGWIQGWRGTGERHALVTFCEPSGFGLASIRFRAFCSPDSRISSPLWRKPVPGWIGFAMGYPGLRKHRRNPGLEDVIPLGLEPAKLGIRSRASHGAQRAREMRVYSRTGFRGLVAIGLAADHQAEQAVHQPGIGIGACHGHIRDDAHVAFTNNLHQLHGGVRL
jgi:hypothetical protein